MDKMNILLISTTKEIDKKLELVEFLLSETKIKSKFFLYTNKEIKTKRKIKTVVLNVDKNELINEGLKEINENVAIINLDYSLKTIKNNFEKILENYKDYDCINFKPQESKIKNFFSNLMFKLYNFVLMLFGASSLLNISSDFQYLSEKVALVMYNTAKSPNEFRLFDNFSGFNTIPVDTKQEKIRYKKKVLFLILALILLSLVIISLGVFIYVCIKHSSSPKLSKVIIVEVLAVIVTLILALGSLTYYKYINSI